LSIVTSAKMAKNIIFGDAMGDWRRIRADFCFLQGICLASGLGV
jgi:hypothetical protein